MKIAPLSKIQKWLIAGFCFLLALQALLAPVWPGTSVEDYLGGLLMWIAVIEIFHGFRRPVESERRSAWYSGAFSFLIAVLLINANLFLGNALYIFISVVLALDALRYLLKYYRGTKKIKGRWQDLAAAIGNILLLLTFFVFKERGIAWALSLVIAFRITGITISMITARTGILEDVNVDVVRAKPGSSTTPPTARSCSS